MVATMAAQVRPARQRTLLLLAVLAVVVLVCGVLIGATLRSDHEDGWHVGQGYVGADQLTVTYDGWHYGATLTVPWIDEQGTWHDDGWPACLERLKSQPIRFQARSVTVEGMSWRPIVAVDCRS
jgi:hypothetical protein